MITKKKKGAASFYIVALATLLLVIIATGFATAVINQITRSSNEDLSQSAYDSALAGIEDAKVALANYQRCIDAGVTGGVAPNGDGKVDCSEIVWWMNHPDCYMVGHILGRIGESEEAPVLVSDTTKTSGGKTNNLNQYYTCVMIDTTIDDYRATLTASNNSKVVKVDLKDVSASSIKTVKIKWYSSSVQTGSFNFSNIVNSPTLRVGNKQPNWRVAFMPLADAQVPTPPVLSLELIQTAREFTMEDFTKVVRTDDVNRTNRATLYMVPTKDMSKADVTKYSKADGAGEYNDSNYQWWGSYQADKDRNYFPARWLADSNSGASGVGEQNAPYLVYCPNDNSSEYACEATIELPYPYDEENKDSLTAANRNSDTFMFVVSLPYGQPDTDFSMEFYCEDGQVCYQETMTVEGGSSSAMPSELAQLAGVQVNIDSTGRANDLYRRVETRLESADASFSYPLYGLQLLGDEAKETLLEKNMTVTVESESDSEYDDYKSRTRDNDYCPSSATCD